MQHNYFSLVPWLSCSFSVTFTYSTAIGQNIIITLSHNVLNLGVQSKKILCFFFSWCTHYNVICCPLVGRTLTVNNLSSPFNSLELWEIQIWFTCICWLLRKTELLPLLIHMNYNWSGIKGRIKVEHNTTLLCVPLFDFILYLMLSQESKMAADDSVAFVQLDGLISPLFFLFQ